MKRNMRFLYGRERPLPTSELKKMGLKKLAVVHPGASGRPRIIEVSGWREDGVAYVVCPKCGKRETAEVFAEIGCSNDGCDLVDARYVS